MNMLAIVILLTCCFAKYEKWELYEPDANEERKGVMYHCKDLDAYYKRQYKDAAKAIDKRKQFGIHISVFPPGKNSQTGVGEKGINIHSSWSKGVVDGQGGMVRVNPYHWGFVDEIKKDENNDNVYDVNGKPVRISAWWPTWSNKRKKIPQAQYKPLRDAYELFVKYGYTAADDSVSNRDLFLDPNERDNGKNKPYPVPDNNAYMEYMDYYDTNQQQQRPKEATNLNYNDDLSVIHHTKKSQSYPHYIANQHSHTEDTDSSSISIPTVFVTLISCMFIFVVCAVYTGCIGLIAGLIGYKMKESQQVSKVESFEEI